MTAARTRRKPIQHTVDIWPMNEESDAVRGAVRVVHPVLRRLRVWWEWDARHGHYVIDRAVTDHVIASLESEGVQVDYGLAP